MVTLMATISREILKRACIDDDSSLIGSFNPADLLGFILDYRAHNVMRHTAEAAAYYLASNWHDIFYDCELMSSVMFFMPSTSWPYVTIQHNKGLLDNDRALAGIFGGGEPGRHHITQILELPHLKNSKKRFGDESAFAGMPPNEAKIVLDAIISTKPKKSIHNIWRDSVTRYIMRDAITTEQYDLIWLGAKIINTGGHSLIPVYLINDVSNRRIYKWLMYMLSSYRRHDIVYVDNTASFDTVRWFVDGGNNPNIFSALDVPLYIMAQGWEVACCWLPSTYKNAINHLDKLIALGVITKESAPEMTMRSYDGSWFSTALKYKYYTVCEASVDMNSYRHLNTVIQDRQYKLFERILYAYIQSGNLIHPFKFSISLACIHGCSKKMILLLIVACDKKSRPLMLDMFSIHKRGLGIARLVWSINGTGASRNTGVGISTAMQRFLAKRPLRHIYG